MVAGQQLVRYDAMLHAIAECHEVDEIEQIHDQAAALEAAARVAMNTGAERQAIEIRIRAERQAGKLMAAMKRAPTSKGGDVKSETARRNGGPIAAGALPGTDRAGFMRELETFKGADLPADGPAVEGHGGSLGCGRAESFRRCGRTSRGHARETVQRIDQDH